MNPKAISAKKHPLPDFLFYVQAGLVPGAFVLRKDDEGAIANSSGGSANCTFIYNMLLVKNELLSKYTFLAEL